MINVAETNGRAKKQVGIGIDLGSSMARMAHVCRTGEVRSLRNAEGEFETPSVILIDDEISVGAEAVRRGKDRPAQQFEAFKRDVGEPHFHRSVRSHWVPPEILTGFLLEKLRQDAEQEVGSVSRATIAVPAHFGHIQRVAIYEASRVAGFEHAEIISEPMAAALAYVKQDESTNDSDLARNMLVYDLGGETFDASVVRIEDNRLATVSTIGDLCLGGYDLDEKLASLIADRFMEECGVDPRSDPTIFQQLIQSAQKAKHELSSADSAKVACEYAGIRYVHKVSRAEFDRLIAAHIERTLVLCCEALREAQLTWADIDDVLLSGGCTRIPLIARALSTRINGTPITTQSPECLVAHGAALFANRRSSQDLDAVELVRVNSRSLGIGGVDPSTGDKLNKIMIPRNTPLPAQATSRFVTLRPNQKSVSVKLLEGESENPEHCRRLTNCVVELEPNLPAGTTINVICHYDRDNTITISAVCPNSRRSSCAEVRRPECCELESLEFWRRRLLYDDSTPADDDTGYLGQLPKSVAPPADERDHLISRLDGLYQQIGDAAAATTVPASVLPTKRALDDARSELQYVQALVPKVRDMRSTATHRHERLHVNAVAAALEEHATRTRRFAEHLRVVLGRECVRLGCCPRGQESHRDEIKQLESLPR